MYTNKRYFSFASPAIIFFTLCFNSPSSAESVLVLFDFDDDLGAFDNAPEVLDPHLTVQAWITNKGSLSNFSGNPGNAAAARNFATSNSVRLTLVPSTGAAVVFDRYSFDHFASASGPQNWMLKINGIEVGGGPTPNTYETAGGLLMLAPLSGPIAIELLGADADSNNGTYRFDNFSLSGAVHTVPIVPSILLFSSGFAALTLRRRR